ncbi:gibberellin-regulated protein 12-like [Amaranthus tricolor]|uniref:gibberellin-regulated protein 12-like n=1 Tax=Amaranthus tricolor TaxID=29722 RepID=UPI002585C034|nr:gibberellin-regulated protein 12-like [Amaranthus tricolor]
MASSSWFQIKVIGLLLLLSMLQFQVSFGGGEGSLKPQDCPWACDYRCSKTHHRKPCLLNCNKCCKKCLCVPSGTYGHKEECPCYCNWKTKKGTPKCP